MLPSCAFSVCHVFVLVLCLSSAEDIDWTKNDHSSFYYGTFPAGFSWGAGSSAYQTEGAWDKDGKGLSIWDVFSHKKGKIQQNDTGDSSCEGYHKVKDDVSLMKELKLNHYRFSISWPRLIPTGIKCLVGISLSGDWGEPVDMSNQKDIEAAERYVQFYLGWFATPIFHGDYPQVMKDFIGRKSVQQGLGTSRLPTFSTQEKSYIKGTCDFLGIGHFTTRYITQKNNPSGRSSSSYFTDRDLAELVDPRWPDPGSEWLYSVPWGFRRLLNFVKTQYGNPMIYVTENGVSEKMLCTELCDDWRIQYYKDYINEMLKAIKDGVNVKGYTAWSLLDKFEWDEGYSERFGLYYVDFRNKNKPRYPKASVQFYKRVISSNGFPNQREVENWRRKAIETCSSSNQLLAAGQFVKNSPDHVYQ
ncbi:hypothetical protein EPR50_G00088330 [Perca flavescens]|uniref:Lactase-like b n=2 Tax=Perca TaxID=8166 RepID=A0A6A5EC20_PERFL|nr:hypothetical protein PFLUV_G00098310 [Perca fluviatilis]TDH09534.1 hypothetical protein EPR50_G00088330 [Perca flavescens]